MQIAVAKDQSSKDESAVRTLIEALHRARRNKDAHAVAALYAPDAAIFNLAPPLSHHGIDLDELEAWFDTWEGPIDLEARDFVISISGDLALTYGFFHLAGTKKGASQPVSFWMRTTFRLHKISNEWKIVSEHTSVPFYMDGSLRPAFDLKP